MRFAWPAALALLVLVPIGALVYRSWLARRRRYAVRFSSVQLVREALPRFAWWRRHGAVVLLLASISALAVGAARPHVERDLARNQTSIILALDISRSMCAIDIPPNRLAVAQQAAKSFISEQADSIKIGIVAFAGTARLTIPPTDDTEFLLSTVDSLQTSFGTALGTAQLEAIDAIAAINDDVPASDEDAEMNGSQDDDVAFERDIVVLLTDGASSRGVDPLEAAAAAADRRVRIFTIGFGTDQPTELTCDNTQIGFDPFGNGEFGSDGVGGDSFGGVTGSFGGGGGRGNQVSGSPQLLVIDEPTLTSIAELTGGTYYRAQDAAQLSEVFAALPRVLELEPEEVEVSVWFTALGFALLLAALALSLAVHRY